MTTTLTSAKQWFISNKQAAFLIKIVFGSSLVALLAQVSVPMIPVPITGQTLGVTIVGFALGRNAAVSALLLYLLEGIVGLPVFANGGSGISSIMGPSGGYLYGFVFSAAILGHFSDKGVLNNFVMSVAVAICASAVVFVFGLIQLSYFVPADKVLEYGFYPFIIGGFIKAILASALVAPTYRFFSKL